MKRILTTVCLLSLSLLGCNGSVNKSDLSFKTDSDWKFHGNTSTEQRFSGLKQINRNNVSQLGLEWYYEFDTSRGQESTPLVVDGIIYTTTSWSKVYALDGKTGRLLWKFDPEVPGKAAANACCDVVNRGLAFSEGRLFLGTFDGRLISLDAKTGDLIWSVLTVDQSKPYSITGAPRVAKGKVYIGNGGADLGVRGYVSAYDVRTGDRVWRFYTVPGDPADGPDGEASDDVLESLASETWYGEEYLKYGGGGTVWDSIVYDEELDQLYVGVGNGSPLNHVYRSEGKGDNLFLSSIIALNPDTGSYIWHYQEVPGETWDYTATQQITLTELILDNVNHKVILHAPKNGFFYVIDRATGKLLSAEKFAPVNWASHIDLDTGRPQETPGARYVEDPFMSGTGGAGVHNWQPMSYSPLTGLVYIPIQVLPFLYVREKPSGFAQGALNLGYELFKGPLPESPEGIAELESILTGSLLAWDPLAQNPAWSIDLPRPYNGGTMTSAGQLVFQGTATGDFNAYDAETGDLLKSIPTGLPILAPPITYGIDGVQYVALMLGNGGAVPLSIPVFQGPSQYPNGRLMVFKLGGSGEMPSDDFTPKPLQVIAQTWPEEVVSAGSDLYGYNCAGCHGEATLSSGVLPDLKRSAVTTNSEIWNAVVIGGTLEDRGMVGFSGELSEKQSEAIRAYVGSEASRIRLLDSTRVD